MTLFVPHAPQTPTLCLPHHVYRNKDCSKKHSVSQPSPRTPCIKSGAPRTRSRIRSATSTHLRRAIRPSLRHTRPGSEPAFDYLGCCDKIHTTAERWPYPCQEIVQVGGKEAGDLWQSGIRTIHDKGHEEHSVREILRVEGYDEERYLASGVILGVRVCVGEGEGGEEGEGFEDKACERLCKSQHMLLSAQRFQGAANDKTISRWS